MGVFASTRLLSRRVLSKTRRAKEYAVVVRRHEHGSLVLHSIRKSGTNYFRIWFANYVTQLLTPGGPPVSYHEMTRMFPNVRDYLLQGKPLGQPTRLLCTFGYRDFMYGHQSEFLGASRAPIVHLYRNPLDVAVSGYFYFLRYRGDKRPLTAETALHVLLNEVRYPKHYLALKELQDKHPSRVLRVPYEVMWRDPEKTFASVLEFFSIPLDSRALRKSIASSSLDTVREEEARTGPIHTPESSPFEGTFVRSGKVGQWQQHMSQQTVESVQKVLVERGLSMDDFDFG